MKELYRWDKLLSHGEEFICGNKVSLVDIAFFPYLAHLVRFGFPLKTTFPKLGTYYDNFSERETVKKTWPSGWRDFKPKQYLK